jgi:CubicO group peptidase (beta-lactamase class C family)
MSWRKSRGEESLALTRPIPEAFGCPLVFEPGEGWTYGGSTDWAGYVVKRLNGNITLDEYFVENIFKPVGCSAPYPTFDLNKHPEAKARLVQASQRAPEGGLGEGFVPFAESPVDEQGGVGLACTANQFMAVLGDIISDAPKLLKHETVTALFTPQFIPKSPAFKSLNDSQAVYQGVTGGIVSDTVYNHTLGGLWCGEEVPKVGQPDGVMAWGGAANLMWFASRRHGVAGFAGSQVFPPGDPLIIQMFDAWKKDLWAAWKG